MQRLHFMMPNHNDVPQHMINFFWTKPLIVKISHIEAQIADGKMCSFQDNIQMDDQESRGLWQKKKKYVSGNAIINVHFGIIKVVVLESLTYLSFQRCITNLHFYFKCLAYRQIFLQICTNQCCVSNNMLRLAV